MQTYVVFTNLHWFEPRTTNVQINKRELNVQFRFNSTNIYEFEEHPNYGQWNKLTGLCDFNCHHHQHSVMLAWRGDINGLELAMYVHNSGQMDSTKRTIVPMGAILLNSTYTAKITIERSQYKIVLGTTFPHTYTVERKKSGLTGFNYIINTYFGGQYPAPQPMYIEMNRS